MRKSELERNAPVPDFHILIEGLFHGARHFPACYHLGGVHDTPAEDDRIFELCLSGRLGRQLLHILSCSGKARTSGDFVDTRPRTTCLFIGRYWRGSKVPARLVSYSS